MKKTIYTLLIGIFCFSFINLKATAANITEYIPHKIIVKFENDFSSKNPPSEFSVVINDNYNIKNCRPLEEGTILYLQLTQVNKEKIGKLNASVQAKITKVYVPSKDKTIIVENKNAVVKFSQYEPIDKKDKAVDAGISVANFFVSNITYPAHFVKGAIKNENGNRLKSGAKEMYDSSALSYASMGKPLVLKSGELATLTFYTKDANSNNNVSNDNTDTSNNTTEETSVNE